MRTPVDIQLYTTGYYRNRYHKCYLPIISNDNRQIPAKSGAGGGFGVRVVPKAALNRSRCDGSLNNPGARIERGLLRRDEMARGRQDRVDVDERNHLDDRSWFLQDRSIHVGRRSGRSSPHHVTRRATPTRPLEERRH